MEAGRDAPRLGGRGRARSEEAREGGRVAGGPLSVKAPRKESSGSVWAALGGRGGSRRLSGGQPGRPPRRHAQSSGPHPEGRVQPGEDLKPGRPQSTWEYRALSVVASRKAALGPGAVNCRWGGRLEHSALPDNKR